MSPARRPAPPLWLLCTAAAVVVVLVASARAAVVAPVTPHGPPKTPAVVTSAAYLSTETDVLDTPGWMRALYGVHLDEEEQRCAAKDEVLYRPLRQCFVLFRRGPCARKQWLVFDKAQAARGVLTVACAPRRCAPGWGFDAARRACFEHAACRPPLAFHYTLFGDGVCRCNATTGGLANAPPDDPASCRELYRRGPCRKGQVLAPRYRLIEGMDAMCFRDPCDGYVPPPSAANASAAAPTPAPAPAATTPATLTKGAPPHQLDHRGGPHHHGHHTTSAQNGRPVWRAMQGGGAGPPPPGGRGSPDTPPDRAPEGELDFDAELLTEANRPNLSVKTSTRAVIGSVTKNQPASVHDHGDRPRHDHGDWSRHDHGDWSRHDRGNWSRHDPAEWSSREHGDWSDHDHEDWFGHGHAHLRGEKSAPVQHTRPLNFSISLKPLPPAAARRSRRGLPGPRFESRATRHARGQPTSRVDAPSTGSGGGSALGRAIQNAAAETEARGRDIQQPSPSVANVTEDYALEVQYSDGNTSCMSPSQLNVVCDLQMVPLFSDFSDVKVPICVNALFRFAIGRVGKSDECAENDKGECAKRVVVKSAEPLDWELE